MAYIGRLITSGNTIPAELPTGSRYAAWERLAVRLLYQSQFNRPLMIGRRSVLVGDQEHRGPCHGAFHGLRPTLSLRGRCIQHSKLWGIGRAPCLSSYFLSCQTWEPCSFRRRRGDNRYFRMRLAAATASCSELAVVTKRLRTTERQSLVSIPPGLRRGVVSVMLGFDPLASPMPILVRPAFLTALEFP